MSLKFQPFSALQPSYQDTSWYVPPAWESSLFMTLFWWGSWPCTCLDRAEGEKWEAGKRIVSSPRQKKAAVLLCAGKAGNNGIATSAVHHITALSSSDTLLMQGLFYN